jgi:lysophospholipase L1-like esterase
VRSSHSIPGWRIWRSACPGSEPADSERGEWYVGALPRRGSVVAASILPEFQPIVPKRESKPALRRSARGAGGEGAPEPPSRGARARILRRIGALLLGLCAALAIAEVALRVTHWQPASMLSKRSLLDRNPARRAWYDCYPSNPNGEFRALPDVSKGSWLLVNNLLPPEELALDLLRETPWCVEYVLSSRGLRGVEIPPEPRAGVVRIALVGDSFVFGEGVPLEKSLPAYLQARLGPTAEVVNLGWPGDDTRRELERLEAALDPLNIHRAVVVFIANDIEMTPELQREQEYMHDLIQVRDRYVTNHQARLPYFGWAHLFRLIGGAWDMRHVKAQTIQWYRDLYDPARNPASLQRFRSYLERLAHLPHCRVAFVLYPLLENLEGDYPLAVVHERVAAMARAAGLPVLDLAPAFAGQTTKELWVHPCDHHPNSRAQAIAGRAIGEWLEHGVPGFLAH